MAETKQKQKNVSTNRLVLLVTIVNRRKAEFFADLLQQMNANLQFMALGEGTADEKMQSMLGLSDTEKAVLLSVIREEKATAALELLNSKFYSIKDGKGIAFTIPFSSVIGAQVFNFLCDNRQTFK